MKLNLYNSLKNPDSLIELLKDADIATLTLVLTQLTSDLSYVNDIKPYVKGAFDYSVNVPEEFSYKIRRLLVEKLIKITNKNNELINKSYIKDKYLSRIMSAGVGAKVPEEYIPMMKEELDLNHTSNRDANIEYYSKR